ncbi:hypothetical protein EVAR_60209_1 [Eumeta japonica]|uniref:Uncharacterized protein n=1 Tax=Eumeta variegata TaxID=151549 RepID=A0A4C1ZCD1_EUMVA|nr:hypothetical protein EVAR_60209_1 [Eumeta japonica]
MLSNSFDSGPDTVPDFDPYHALHCNSDPRVGFDHSYGSQWERARAAPEVCARVQAWRVPAHATMMFAEFTDRFSTATNSKMVDCQLIIL